MPKVDVIEPLVVYGFCGSIPIATGSGTYWATAVGGRVLSRPTGNPFVLFSLEYIWDMAGSPLEFPEPIKLRLNTSMAVIESIDFKFPEPEPEPQPEPEVARVNGSPSIDADPVLVAQHAAQGQAFLEGAEDRLAHQVHSPDDELEDDFGDDFDDGEEEELEEDEYIDEDEITELPYS